MSAAPDGHRKLIAKACGLEWLSLAYLCSTCTLLWVVMGGSQALKTELVGDALSMIAPALFLIGGRVSAKRPTESYPYGFERAVSAGYLGAALTLLATGAFLFFDSGMKVVRQEHPSVGTLMIAGHLVWIGWLALPTLLWSSIPAFFLGRAKREIGERLHDKVLRADAETNAADWQSASCAMVGVLGIAFGIWWLDALAGLVISVEILRSGSAEVRTALGDILDRRPLKIDGKEPDPLPERLTEYFRRKAWVQDVVVRIRERGREFSAEAFVTPADETGLLDRLETARKGAMKLDDRLCELVIVPVKRLSDELQSVRADQPDDR